MLSLFSSIDSEADDFVPVAEAPKASAAGATGRTKGVKRSKEEAKSVPFSSLIVVIHVLMTFLLCQYLFRRR